MRKKSLFHKKIKCEICGSGFKIKREGKTNRYVCSGYENKSGCTKRIKIDEDLLIGLINRRYQRELSEDEIREVVVEIIVHNELHFDIILSEGIPISFHEHGIIF